MFNKKILLLISFEGVVFVGKYEEIFGEKPFRIVMESKDGKQGDS